MTVKRSRSATRVLTVLEGIAQHQPVGVSELARLLADDKSAVQRAIMTLADSGWISACDGTPRRWQLTARLLTLAHTALGGNDLLVRCRGTLESLRSETGESVLLTAPDVNSFVVIDALESRQMLRTVPTVGMPIPVRGSATSRAILPYMSREEQTALLGSEPDAALLKHFAATLTKGYGVNDGDILPGSTNLAAPIFGLGGKPEAAIVVSAPSDRLPPEEHDRVGHIVAQAARSLSRSAPQTNNKDTDADASGLAQ